MKLLEKIGQMIGLKKPELEDREWCECCGSGWSSYICAECGYETCQECLGGFGWDDGQPLCHGCCDMVSSDLYDAMIGRDGASTAD